MQWYFMRWILCLWNNRLLLRPQPHWQFFQKPLCGFFFSDGCKHFGTQLFSSAEWRCCSAIVAGRPCNNKCSSFDGSPNKRVLHLKMLFVVANLPADWGRVCLGAAWWENTEWILKRCWVQGMMALLVPFKVILSCRPAGCVCACVVHECAVCVCVCVRVVF